MLWTIRGRIAGEEGIVELHHDGRKAFGNAVALAHFGIECELHRGEPVVPEVGRSMPEDHFTSALSMVALAGEIFDEVIKIEGDEPLVEPTPPGAVN